jgi:hypothetical protein
MASLETSLMVKVLQISKKCWRLALASSCAFPQNWLACAMLINAGFSSKFCSISAAGLVRMLAVVGAKNSLSDLSAMASNSDVKFRTMLGQPSKSESGASSWDDDVSAWTLFSLALSLLNSNSGFSMKLSGWPNLLIYYPT